MCKKIIVTTLCDSKEIALKIQNELLNMRLVAGCQISEVESTYYWNGKIENAHEYKLEMRSKENLFQEIEQVIKQIHNYEVCELSYLEIKGANKEFLDWIDRETK